MPYTIYETKNWNIVIDFYEMDRGKEYYLGLSYGKEVSETFNTKDFFDFIQKNTEGYWEVSKEKVVKILFHLQEENHEEIEKLLN